METKDRKKLGKKTRKEGKEFEKRVYSDLVEKGWIVNRWSNDVQFEKDIKEFSICEGKDKHTGIKIDGKETNYHFEPGYTIKGTIVQAKMKWLPTPRGRFPVNTTPGFPDFLCFKQPDIESIGHYNQTFNDGKDCIDDMYELIAVESKISGTLDKIEKEKCRWYLDNHIFSKILIASKHKIKNRIHIEYKEFNNFINNKNM